MIEAVPQSPTATLIALDIARKLGLDLRAIDLIVPILAPHVQANAPETVEEIARRFSVSPEQVNRLVKLRKVNAINVGAGAQPSYRIRPEEFERCLSVNADHPKDIETPLPPAATRPRKKSYAQLV